MRERTERINARVPSSLIKSAEQTARRDKPDITRSGLIRWALALAAGETATEVDRHAADLPRMARHMTP
jgi:hypothetical protein